MQPKIHRILAALLALFALTFVAVPSASAGGATDVVRSKQTQLFDLVRKPTSAENEKKIASLFDEMLDYSSLAEASLGTEWANRTSAERDQFSELLKKLVQNAYKKNLKKTLDFDIEYKGETTAGDGGITVKTKAVHKTDSHADPIEIAFEMSNQGGVWKVKDIDTEGVSLVDSYRRQFTNILKKDGWAKLIEKMEQKVAKSAAP